jgi:hypothetical protein
VFVWLYRFFPSILNAITIIKPETVSVGIVTASAPIGAGNLARAGRPLFYRGDSAAYPARQLVRVNVTPNLTAQCA